MAHNRDLPDHTAGTFDNMHTLCFFQGSGHTKNDMSGKILQLVEQVYKQPRGIPGGLQERQTKNPR